ncbi:hypothetical protein [Shewanella sp. CAL98-MNA-CIBAN-0140]|uniref:hypothetical protein n=1 Tax=unclassified Shewanella TaxID=196818 RepID=UPI003320A7BD
MNLQHISEGSFEFLDEIYEEIFFVPNDTKRGILKNSGKLLGAAFSFGGSYSLERQNKHYLDFYEAMYKPTLDSLISIENRTKQILSATGNILQQLNKTLKPVEKVLKSKAGTNIYPTLRQYEKFSTGCITSMRMGFGGLVGGTAALGAWGVVTVVGSASTGTAISSLSGVAATNATLAWFGGGSLATGGAGMAGGFWVLGGIVAAPMIYFTTKNAYKKVKLVEIQKAKLINETDKLYQLLPQAKTELLTIRKHNEHITTTMNEYIPLIEKELLLYKTHNHFFKNLFGIEMNPKQDQSFKRLSQLTGELLIELGID